MKCGIYKITCLPTGKVYIGSSKNISGRWRAHKSLLNRGVSKSLYLQSAWNKYGPDSFCFEVVELCDDSDLISRERCWISSFPPDDTFNIADPINPMYGRKHSKESKEKMSRTRISKGYDSPMKGKTHTLEARNKMKAKRAQREPVSNSTRKRMSESHSKAIIGRNLTTKEERFYPSIGDAGADGFVRSGIYRCVKGKSLSYKNHSWKLAGE